jgi:hypothetical protein
MKMLTVSAFRTLNRTIIAKRISGNSDNMENPKYRNETYRYLMIGVVCLVTLLFPPGLSSMFGELPTLSSPSQETLRLGERMYREGIFPSGKPMLTSVTGGAAIPGSTFACASCHLRSGVGVFNENVYTPPVNGAKLFQPRYVVYKGIVLKPEYSQSPPLRPAYTDETLKAVIRSGKDPTGRELNTIMPRYILEDREAIILVNYLKSLSLKFSPGVTETTFRFATVTTADAPLEECDALLSSLESYVKKINDRVNFFKTLRGARSRQMTENMLVSREFATKNLSLSHWVLNGPPDTWRSQLEEYNRQEPVFALLGGIVNDDWKPIHQFSEDNRIPCLFPNTDFPVISDTDWYTLYLSKGYYQEGESVARYLNSKGDLIKDKAIVQMVRASREGQALSTGFQQTWQNFGHQGPITVTLPAGKVLSKSLFSMVLSKNKPVVLILWDDSTILPMLELLTDRQNRPKLIFVSSRYLGKSIWTLKEQVRDVTYITYPFAFSPYVPNVPKAAMGEQKAQTDRPTLRPPDQLTLRQADIPLKDNKQKITNLTNALTQLLSLTLMDMKGNYYRDYLLDVMGTMMGKQYPLYGQISFGPSQRYASTGCYIVQLSKGDEPALVKKSGWEIY